VISESWRRLLTPEIFRRTLKEAALFLAAFRLLEDEIVDRLRDFYATEFDAKGRSQPSDSYRSEVLSRGETPLVASLAWLKHMEALDESDLEKFERVLGCRTEIVSQMPEVLTNGPRSDMRASFRELVELVEKIGKWWIIQVEILTNPDFDGKEVSEGDVSSGVAIALKILPDIAFGSDAIAEQYLQIFLSSGPPRAADS
jgi:hypothetical protein